MQPLSTSSRTPHPDRRRIRCMPVRIRPQDAACAVPPLTRLPFICRCAPHCQPQPPPRLRIPPPLAPPSRRTLFRTTPSRVCDAPPTPTWLDSADGQAPGCRPFVGDRRPPPAPRTLPFSENFRSAPTHNAVTTNAATRIHFQGKRINAQPVQPPPRAKQRKFSRCYVLMRPRAGQHAAA